MKKIIIILLTFFPLVGFAKTDYIKLDCPIYDVGETIECKLYANSNYYITAVEYEYNLPNQVEYIEFIKDDIWEGEQINNTLYLFTSNKQIGDILLGKIKVKIKESINNIDIQSVHLTYTDEEFNDKKIDVNSIENYEVKKNNNIYYVIIIIGIMLIIGIITIIVRRRKI